MADIIEWPLAEKAAMDQCAAIDWSDDDDPDMPTQEGPVEQATQEEFRRRSDLYAEAAAEIARLRAAEREAFRRGVEAAAAVAKAHRQELFSDGLAGDVHNLTKVEAFLAGCDQERDCIEAAIRAIKEPEPT